MTVQRHGIAQEDQSYSRTPSRTFRATCSNTRVRKTGDKPQVRPMNSCDYFPGLDHRGFPGLGILELKAWIGGNTVQSNLPDIGSSAETAIPRMTASYRIWHRPSHP